MNIEQHDLETKLKRGEKFLQQGDKIKMVMQFRGREMAYRDSGLVKFKGIVKMVEEMGATVESVPKMMGNRIITIVSPDKVKMAAMAKEAKIKAKAEARMRKLEAEADAAEAAEAAESTSSETSNAEQSEK